MGKPQEIPRLPPRAHPVRAQDTELCEVKRPHAGPRNQVSLLIAQSFPSPPKAAAYEEWPGDRLMRLFFMGNEKTFEGLKAFRIT